MIKPKYSKKMMVALDDTIQSYMDSIFILESDDHSDEAKARQLRRWKNYGTTYGCKLCKACDVICGNCVLYTSVWITISPCAVRDSETLTNLKNAIRHQDDHKAIAKAMSKRLDFIIARASQNIGGV